MIDKLVVNLDDTAYRKLASFKLEGFTNEEIAKKMGVSTFTVPKYGFCISGSHKERQLPMRRWSLVEEYGDMAAPNDSTADNLPLVAMKQIDAICDEFEAALTAGSSPLITAYADQVPEQARRALLCELARLELDFRQRRR